MKKKILFLVALAILACTMMVLSSCSQWDTPYEDLDREGATVSVKFDPNGGMVASTNGVTIVDVFNVNDYTADASGNVSIPLVIILIPTLFYFAYNEKTFFIRLLMLGLFSALVYFSSHISFQSKICDYLGQLSARIYLYMAFAAMLRLLGLTHYRVLFVIDVALATLDLALSI